MITLYIITSYLVMLGMMIQANESVDTITSKEWVIFSLSPFTLPILIGMMIANK